MTNPYNSPIDPTDGQPEACGIQFRVFGGPTLSFKLSAREYRNDVRRRVQQAIASEIGSTNVISINEQVESLGSFSIVVWYRG